MTNLSIMARDSFERADGVLVSFINALVTSGKLSHVFQAVFILCPAKKDVLSHPVKAWTTKRHLDLDGRRVSCKQMHGKDDLVVLSWVEVLTVLSLCSSTRIPGIVDLKEEE